MSNLTPEPSDRHAASRQEMLPRAFDDVTPPVEKPGVGTVVQLVLVFLIIVVILVTILGVFSWLAHMGSHPGQLVQDFDQPSRATWQKALTLANVLRAPKSGALRRDSQLAQRLATILDRAIDAGDVREEHLRFRMYLCRALGEFYVADGLPVLLRAASESSSIDQWQVRQASLQAIARLADHMGASEIEASASLLPILRRIAAEKSDRPNERQPRAKLRATVAFLLGLLESNESLEALAVLLGDPEPWVRYNTAAGLARRGDQRAIPQIVEMLDPGNHELPTPDNQGGGQPGRVNSDAEWSRTHVMKNALRSAQQLAAKNVSSDFTSLERALDRLLRTKLSGALRVEAEMLSRALHRRRPQAASD